jgi:MoaA/NifB/PqqE/SkfB family radical SAM enzyme
MLTGIHFLLTYSCTFECDHCFLYCSPEATGTFTARQIEEVLDEAIRIGTVEWIFFEGGEPFLFHPLLLAGAKMARQRDFKIGLVSNCYWATTSEDAELWLRPLLEIGIDDLSLSDDAFHQGEVDDKANTARQARTAAERLGMPVGSICIDKPEIIIDDTVDKGKGQPVVGGGALIKGRAADKLIEGLQRHPFGKFTRCPHEELVHPERLHIDSFGNVHICQGISMGNMWETPLSTLVKNYDAAQHPVCGPLAEGGPALLAQKYDAEHEEVFVDACHFCFTVRKALIDRFPEYLTPKQVYGLE